MYQGVGVDPELVQEGRQALLSCFQGKGYFDVKVDSDFRTQDFTGVSQLSINPVLAGSTQGPPGANITIQQRVTGDLFITFSSNVASTQNQVISGQYQLSPRVAVSATKDQNGGFAFDTLIKKTW